MEPNYKGLTSRWGATEEVLAAMRKQVAGFEHLVPVSALLVLSDPDEIWIKSSIDSVLQQVYPYVEVCVCINGSKKPHVWEVLEGYAGDERIKVRHLPEKHGQAEAYNVALSMVTGEVVALLGQGDELSPDALFRVVEFLQHVRADVIYTDEDSIDVTGERLDPVFKLYWSPDLLLSTPYTGRLSVVRRKLLEAVGGFRQELDGAEEHDLLLRLSEMTDRIYHLPGVLYHRRRLPWPDTPEKGQIQASLRAIEDALARRGEDSSVEPGPAQGSFRVVRHVIGRPKVSVIVSAPQGMAAVPIVDELKRRTSYPIHQLIVASDGPKVHRTADHVSDSFPARALNLAARRAGGEYLVFVDGGLQITTPEWLAELLSEAQRQSVGAVGCTLLNPDGILRQGGSLIEVGRLVGYEDDSVLEDQAPLLVDHVFNFAAASAGCMMVAKHVFDEMGGFDDEMLPTAFYDLDLSFRLQEKGLRNVYTPYASLIHAGSELQPGAEEIAYMWRRWWEQLVRLLYYRWSPLRAGYREISGEASLLSAY